MAENGTYALQRQNRHALVHCTDDVWIAYLKWKRIIFCCTNMQISGYVLDVMPGPSRDENVISI